MLISDYRSSSSSHSGKNFMHAANKDRGDLQRGREKLLEMGFVCRDNVDGRDIDVYRDQLRDNEALNRRREEAYTAQVTVSRISPTVPYYHHTSALLQYVDPY